MANEVVNIRINVSADDKEIDKVRRKLAAMSAQGALTGNDLSELGDALDGIGAKASLSGKGIDDFSKSNSKLGKLLGGNGRQVSAMTKIFDGFIKKIGGIGMFVMKAWGIHTALLGVGLVSIAAGFKVAAAAAKLFQGTMAAIAAGTAAAAVAITSAAAAYRQYIGATNAVNYGPDQILGNRQATATAAFRSIQSDRSLASLGPQAIQGSFAAISQNAAFTGDMNQSLKSLADFAIASGDVEKGMQAAGQFLGMLRKEGKLTEQVSAMGDALGPQFQEALQAAVKQGKISEADFLSALNAGSLNQKVLGLLDGVNQTLFGQAKSFVSEIIGVAGDIGEGFLPDIQRAFKDITKSIRVAMLEIGLSLGGFAKGDFITTIVSGVEKLNNFLVNLFQKFLPKSDGMLGDLKNWFREIGYWFKNTKEKLRPLAEGGQILIDAFAPLANVFGDSFTDGLKHFNELIIQYKPQVMEFGQSLAGAFSKLSDIFATLRESLVKSLPTLSRVADLIGKILSLINGLFQGANATGIASFLPLLSGFLGFGMLKQGILGKRSILGSLMMGSNFGMGGGRGGKGGGGGGFGGFIPWLQGGGLKKATYDFRQGLANGFNMFLTGTKKATTNFRQGLATGIGKFQSRRGSQGGGVNFGAIGSGVAQGAGRAGGFFKRVGSGIGGRVMNSKFMQREVTIGPNGISGLPWWMGGGANGAPVGGPNGTSGGRMAGMMGKAGSFLPFAMMAGSLFGSKEAQTPMMMGAMASQIHPLLGLGVAGAGTAFTAKTPMGGAAGGALAGGAAGFAIGGPAGAAAGAVIGGIAGAIKAKVNRSNDIKAAAEAMVDSFSAGTDAARKKQAGLGGTPEDFRKRIDQNSQLMSELGVAVGGIKNYASRGRYDDQSFNKLTRGIGMTTKERKDVLSGRRKASEFTDDKNVIEDINYSRAKLREAMASRDKILTKMLDEGIVDEKFVKSFKNQTSGLDPKGDIEKLMSDLQGAVGVDAKKSRAMSDQYNANVAVMSQMTGYASDTLREFAASAGVDLTSASINFIDALNSMGMAIPATMEELIQNIQGEVLKSVNDIYDQAFGSQIATERVNQIGEDWRNTRGPLGDESIRTGLRDMAEGFIQYSKTDPYDAMRRFREGFGFGAGEGKMYEAGAPLEGRRSEFQTPEAQNFINSTIMAMKGIVDTQTTAALQGRIGEVTGGKEMFNAETLKAAFSTANEGQMQIISQKAFEIAAAAKTSGETLTGEMFASRLGTQLQGTFAAPLSSLATMPNLISSVQGSVDAAKAQFAQAPPWYSTAPAWTQTPLSVGPVSGSATINITGQVNAPLAATTTVPLAGAGAAGGRGAGALLGPPAAGNPFLAPPGRGNPPGPVGGPPDTTSSRLAATMARHASLNRSLAGKRSITSSLRFDNLGSLGSDHATGAAYDIIGQNLGAYQRLVQTSGGFAEFHGGTGGRHLHVVPGPGVPAGDSATPAMVTPMPTPAAVASAPVYNVTVNGGNASPEQIANTVMARIAERDRSMKERS